MFNYLALQGWSYDDHTEIMSRAEVVERFTIDRVQPSPARWNPDKLKDMNGLYIRKLSTAEVAERIAPFLSRAGLIGDPPGAPERAYVERLTPLVHERLEELGDAPELLEFFFRDVAPQGGAATLEYDPALLIPKKLDAAGAHAALAAAYDTLAQLEPWSEGQLEEALRALAEQLELKPGQLFGALRVASTGRTVAPPLFETLAALGKERSLARIAAARDALA
jgi:glutamyl-tRNA synthetase